MWIFISRLPKDAKRRDVVQFVNRALKPGWLMLPLTTRARLTRCEVMQIVDRDNGVSELHGLAEIEPGKMVPGIIERLNGAQLKGKTITVHQYRHRSPNKDRRAPGWMMGSSGSGERRKADRRRAHLNIEMLRTPRTEVMSSFHRVHY